MPIEYYRAALQSDPDFASARAASTQLRKFFRVLGRYVRERGVLDFTTAVHKMTRMPADRIGLAERGRIAVGAFADIAVLDPDEVIDRATFADPHQLSAGVHHVFVNGEAVLLNGVMTGARPGKVLRHQ
jgi:N-acyl-D-aspartate/D-glutamate deacylase